MLKNAKSALGIFLDCEDLKTIEEHMDRYALEGVTTNPSLISRLGDVDFRKYLRDMRKLLGGKVFMTQVVSSDSKGMLEEAEMIRKCCGGNTFVKFPCVPEGFRAMKIFAARGGGVTGTLCFSLIQGALALLAGASYVAPYYGGMKKAGTDSLAVIRQLATFIERSGCKGRILVASCHSSAEMGDIYEAGGDTVTVSPSFFKEIFAPGLDKYQRQFVSDWAKAHPQGGTLLDLAKK